MDYQEKLRLAKEALDSGSYDRETIEYIFPELKKESENEDERIKNFLISKMKEVGNVWEEYSSKDIIAWLEKQGINISSFPEEQRKYMEKYLPFDKVTLIKLLAERDRNVEKITKSFEKQGEQKANEIHPIFRVGDYIRNKKTCDKVLIEQLDVKSKAYYYTSYDGAAEIHSDLSFSKQDEWELIGQLIVEQKPTDKAEPKFKAGDWVVPNNGEPRVFRVEKRGWPDSIISGSFGSEYVNTFTLDKQYHLWSIQDAKDGDVIATDSDSICIFDGTVEDGKYPFAYCGLTGHYGFEVYDRKLPFTHNNDVRPATKEQRDLLFYKMKEAGYEWDAEKKELKKIEQKPVDNLKWNELTWEDINTLEEIINNVHYEFRNGIGEESFGKEVLERFRETKGEEYVDAYEQKLAWSEEDEVMLDEIIDFFENGTVKLQHDLSLYASWLKSLKERCTWKPSDEQMQALSNAGNSFRPFEEGHKILWSLYNDLKKLRKK